MAINKELLLAVKQRILGEPEAFDMMGWGHASPWTQCGTVACIAGHTVHLANGQTLGNLDDEEIEWEARDLLGLSKEESQGLFFVSRWPDEFKVRHHTANSFTARAQVAADYIDYFIATRA